MPERGESGIVTAVTVVSLGTVVPITEAPRLSQAVNFARIGLI